MVPRALSDLSTRASGRVAKNSARGKAECTIFSIRWQPGSGCTSKNTTASALFLISHWTGLPDGNLQCDIFDITLWFGWQCAG